MTSLSFDSSSLHNIMTLIDENKKNFSEADYVKMCNVMKNAHESYNDNLNNDVSENINEVDHNSEYNNDYTEEYYGEYYGEYDEDEWYNETESYANESTQATTIPYIYPIYKYVGLLKDRYGTNNTPKKTNKDVEMERNGFIRNPFWRRGPDIGINYVRAIRLTPEEERKEEIEKLEIYVKNSEKSLESCRRNIRNIRRRRLPQKNKLKVLQNLIQKNNLDDVEYVKLNVGTKITIYENMLKSRGIDFETEYKKKFDEYIESDVDFMKKKIEKFTTYITENKLKLEKLKCI